jgi:hypothetical protein
MDRCMAESKQHGFCTVSLYAPSPLQTYLHSHAISVSPFPSFSSEFKPLTEAFLHMIPSFSPECGNQRGYCPKPAESGHLPPRNDAYGGLGLCNYNH